MLNDSAAARAVIAAGPRPAQFDDRLQMRAVKAWIDGALGSRGAAMLNDYSDQPHHRGLMLYTREQMDELVRLTSRHGWQLNVHAIGDAGNRIVLDAFETQLTAQQRERLRPRIEHAQVVGLEDVPRFAQLGVIASIQPTHATSDMNMAEDRVGAERIKGAYAWRKLLNSGARLAGGSDFPVELANPFHGLYAAVTRQDRGGRPPGGWYPRRKTDARGSTAPVHRRRCVRRAHGEQRRYPRTRQMGGLHSRRPRLLQSAGKRDRRHHRPRDIRGGKEGRNNGAGRRSE